MGSGGQVKDVVLAWEEECFSSEMGLKQEIDGERRYRKLLKKELILGQLHIPEYICNWGSQSEREGQKE